MRDLTIERRALRSYLENCFSDIGSADPSLFTKATYKDLLLALQQLQHKYGNLLVDAAVLTSHLEQSGRDQDEITACVGALTEVLAEPGQAVANHEYLVSQLALLGEARFWAALSAEIKTRIQSKDVATLADDVTDKVLDRSLTKGDNGSVASRAWLWGDAKERWEAYQKASHGGSTIVGIPSGIGALDEVTQGIMPASLWCFYGTTGIGKSKLLINVAHNVSQLQVPVLYISYEMPRDMLANCFDSRASLLDFTRIKGGALSEDDRSRLEALYMEQPSLKPPIYIIDANAETTREVELEIALAKRTFHDVPPVVIVDYAGLLEPYRRYAGMSDRFNYVFDDLHRMAKKYNTAIITAFQESRKGQTDEGERVGLHYIGLSNYIAPHCELVVHLQRTNEDRIRGQMRMVIEKSRYAPANEVHQVWWAPHLNYIGDSEIKVVPSSKVGPWASEPTVNSSNDEDITWPGGLGYASELEEACANFTDADDA